MTDQADVLRQLVRERAASHRAVPGRRPRLLVVAGGKGGVGTTTVAVNLAVALAARGRETVLVDADTDGGDAAGLCGLEDHPSLADVLAGRRTVREALQPGPGGVGVLPAAWGEDTPSPDPACAVERFLEQLDDLSPRSELVVLDVGNSRSRLADQFWQAADLVLAVTTPETAAIMDTYAAVKVLGGGRQQTMLQLVVNLSGSAQCAESVHDRLARACHRFLALELGLAGWLPVDPRVAEAAQAGKPLVLASPGCDAAAHVETLVQRLSALLAASAADSGKKEQERLNLCPSSADNH